VTTVDLLISAAHVLTMDGPGVGYVADTALAIDRSRIVAIGPRQEILQAYSAERTVEGAHHVMLPGLIDAHMHTAWCLLRGLAQDTRYWMMHGLGPFTAHISPAAMEAGTRLAVLEAVRAGTTTFSDFGWSMESVCAFFEQAGVRGAVAVTIREAEQRIYAPGELYTFDAALGRRQFEANLRLFDRWHAAADGRLRIFFGPQGADFLSRDLLLDVQQAAHARNTKIHMHVAQGDREIAQVEQRYGRRTIPWLDELGLLDRSLMAVHLTEASDDEARLVARRGASMALCSGSIGIIDGIVPPAAAFQSAGGVVALGSDQAPGNNNHNIFNEMKLTALFNKVRARDPEVMPAWRVLRMATIEGAAALGWDDEIGSLSVGKRADVVLVDTRRPTLAPVHLQPMRNLVPNLVYAARGDEVDTVVINGELVLDNTRLVTISEEEILTDVQSLAAAIGPQAETDFWRIDNPNACAMRDGNL
jgi:5-methylthioadenosine/S-adenosylhomocysteine deaminase